MNQRMITHFKKLMTQWLLPTLAMGLLSLSIQSTQAFQKPAEEHSLPDVEAAKYVEPTRRTVVLKLLEKQIQSNYEKMSTWQGSYRFSTKRIFEVPPLPNGKRLKLSKIDPKTGELEPLSRTPQFVNSQATMEFQIDFKANRIYSNFNPKSAPESFSDDDGKRYQMLPTPRTTIQTPEHALTLQKQNAHGHRKNDPKVAGWSPLESVIIRRDPKESVNTSKLHGDVFDPRLLFGDGPRSFVDELHASVEKSRKNPTANSLEIAELNIEGATIYQKVTFPKMPGKGKRFKRVVTFDSSVGFNVSAVQWIELPAKRIYQDSRWTYKKQDGIFIPASFRLRQFATKTNTLKYERSLVLAHAILNKPLAENQFTEHRFNLKEGDRMVDSIRDELMILHNNEWVTSVDFLESHQASVSRKKWLTLFTIACSTLGLVALFYGFTQYRRWSQHKSMVAKLQSKEGDPNRSHLSTPSAPTSPPTSQRRTTNSKGSEEIRETSHTKNRESNRGKKSGKSSGRSSRSQQRPLT